MPGEHSPLARHVLVRGAANYSVSTRQETAQMVKPERIESQEIGVTGHDQIGMAVDRQLEKFVVVRITTGGDPLGDGDQFCPSQQFCQVVAEGRDRHSRDLRSR
jgi:hypothetical protein